MEPKTNNRFENLADYETYVNAIDDDYDSEDVMLTGWVNSLKSTQFKLVERNSYGKGAVFKQIFVDVLGNNTYIPPSGYCIMKFIHLIIGNHYEQEF